MIIYKAQNKINEKIYIGQTKDNLKKRIVDHERMGYIFHKALVKYGLQNFDISIIDLAKTKEELNEKERYWIKFYNCKVPNGYNLTDGGEGNSGYIWTEKDRKKMSRLMMGKCFSQDHRKNLSESIKNSLNNLNTREKMKRPKSEDHRKKIGDSIRGKPSGKKGKTYSKEIKEGTYEK